MPAATVGPDRRGQLVVILVTVALVVGPLVYFAARREIAKWFLAMAMEQRYEERLDEALELTQKSLAWDPTDIQVLFEQTDIYLSLGDVRQAPQSLTDRCNWPT